MKNRLLKDVKSSGAVSPAMRARATRIPVMIPGSAAGTITPNAARARVAPSARPPRAGVAGTSFSSSSVVRVTMGIIMKPSATPPASAEKRCTGRTTRP